MEEFMNVPIEKSWTNSDIIREYYKCKDKKKVSRIYGIMTKEVTEILNVKKGARNNEKNFNCR